MSKRAEIRKVVTIKQAIDSFLLSCKVEGKSYGVINGLVNFTESHLGRIKGSDYSFDSNYLCESHRS
jgi:hypothetical protein